MNDIADNPAQGTGLDTAAKAIEAILAGNSSDNQEPKKPDEAEVSSDELETLADDAEEETPTAEDAEDAEAEEAEPEEEEGEAEEEELPKVVTVKIDGKAMEVPLDEVVAGYQRQADYSRKTQALAEERKALEQEKAQVQTERVQYAQVLSALQAQLSQQMEQQPDWDRLYAEDPIEWVRQREVWREKQEKLAAARIEQARLAEQQTVEQQQMLSQHLQSERNRLIEAIPTWKDAKVWERDRQQLREYGRKFGFTDEELSQAYDHRAVVALYKSMKYDALMAARKTVRPDPAPPAQTPRKSAAVSPRPVSDVTRAKQRLAKTGSVRDAAAVFEKLI